MSLIIGLSGVAGAGKDLFFSLLKKSLAKNKINVCRLALADGLKSELSSHILKLYGVNIFECDRETKNLYRPFLVFHGELKRKLSNGRHWIDKISQRVNSQAKNKIYCITDIRYAGNELAWLRTEKNGILVHISQYSIENGEKIFKSPPNKEEAENDPILKKEANYRIEWKNIKGSQDIVEETLSKYIEDFTAWLKENESHRLRFND